MTDHRLERVIAVTGSIGSGKSLACRFLKENGAFIVEADRLAREVVEPGSHALAELAALFGPTIVRTDGTLDRKALGALIFSDAEARRRLEAITHPRIRKLAEERLGASDANLVVYDCPLLFEAGLETSGFGAIVLIAADPEVCLERIVRRDGLTADEALRRIRAQIPIDEKRRRSGIVIENSGTVEELREKIGTLAKRLTSEMASNKRSPAKTDDRGRT